MFCGVVGGDGCGDCDALGGKNGLTGLRLYVRVVWGGQAMNVCVSDRTAERRIGRRLVSGGGCSSTRDGRLCVGNGRDLRMEISTKGSHNRGI